MTMPKASGRLYIADPMCSWCWGFAPVVQSITERFGNQFPIWVIMGGLAPGETKPLNGDTKTSIREHWDHVHEATGQPFNYDFFEQDGFVYDTEPPSRAVVAARQIDPFRAMDFLEYLHGAFYRDNQDITNNDKLCDLAQECGFNRQDFANALHAESIKKAARNDFITSRKLGITGFPSLIGQAGDQLTVLSNGYRPWEHISRIIDSWLQRANNG